MCESAKITSVVVPQYYVLDDFENPKPITLDCIYEIGANETGFVLKWNHNKNNVYQWILNMKPHALVSNIYFISHSKVL